MKAPQHSPSGSSLRRGSYLAGLIVVATILFAFAAVAFSYFVVFGSTKFQTLPEGVYIVRLSEYEISSEPEPIIVKAGEPVILQIVNEGTVEHELMFVADLGMMANMIKTNAMKLAEQNPDLSEEDIIAMIDEIHDEMIENMMKAFQGKVDGDLMIELEPGERKTVTYTFYQPGVYTIACFELEGTFPSPHAENGMFNQVIVVQG
ncbi:MAG: hypothetical protein F7C07_06790 [Desulfurococcales archaeon]|nr:hypothetical protein [Desulfurococcales archaeon]